MLNNIHSQASPARIDKIETIAALRIRRPCNSNPPRVVSITITLRGMIAVLAMFAVSRRDQKDKLAERLNDNAQQMVGEL